MLEDNHSDTANDVGHGVPSVTLTRRLVECVGPVFFDYWKGPDSESELDSDSDSEDEDMDTDDFYFFRRLNPKEWKDQDHYAVLGLKELRYQATDDDIKEAYRLKVLRHHPDKRRARGIAVHPDGDYFTCITRAYDILGNPRNRRSYDSVDPEFDNTVPPANENSRTNFFEVFGKVFDLNSRWSEKMPVPSLGNESTHRELVEHFYSFWYDFESWREYSYLDEEEKDQAQGREKRNRIEKRNIAARAKRKKEEMARIRTLVDTAYSLDPRIQKFKQADKDHKLAFKEAKKVAARARHEEEERKAQAAEEELRKQKEEAEAEQRAKQEAIKAERETLKRALKKERTELRKIAKENNYYAEDTAEEVKNMANLEKICECLRLEELEELVSSLSLEGRPAFLRAIEETERRIEQERQELMESASRTSGSGAQGKTKTESASWPHEQLQLLIKAVNMFPAGTTQRWEAVASFVNQHSTRDVATRTSKEALTKAKDLKICPAEQQGPKTEPWTAMEQKLLEQGLKTYPPTTPERWDRIAECLSTRTKKVCMRRYKALVEFVKAKKSKRL